MDTMVADRVIIAYGVIALIILIYGVYKAFSISRKYKNIKLFKTKEKEKNYLYYRELPNKNNTAAGVAFLTKNLKDLTYRDYTNTLNKVIQATILELALKDYLELPKDSQGNTIIKILDKDQSELKESQRIILNFIITLANGRSEISISELKNLYKERKDIYRKTFKGEFLYTIIDEQKELGNCSEDDVVYRKNLKNFVITFFILATIIFISMFIIIPILGEISLMKHGIEPTISSTQIAFSIITVIAAIITLIVNIKIIKAMRTNRKLLYKDDPNAMQNLVFYTDILAFLTEKGAKERKQWIALKKFIKEYSLMKEYTTNTLEINQEYLVYATLFGIADNVQKELGDYGVINLYWDEQKPPKRDRNYRGW